MREGRSPAATVCGVVVLAAIACLPGCAAVRDARRAQDPASAGPGERTATAAELGLPATGRLRLEDAIAASLRAHPDLVRARLAEEAAAARASQAESDYWPQLSASASKQYRDQRAQIRPSSQEEHRFESLGFQVSWLLFDFGRTPALARESAAQWLAAQCDRRSAEVDTVFGVRSAYATLLKQLRLRDVARDAVGQFQLHLEQVKEFVRVGTRIPYDETKAEVDLGNARLTLVQAEDAVLTAQANLASAIGLAETTDWEPEPGAAAPAAQSTFEECWAVARRSRPALAAAGAREEASTQLVNARIASLYPQMSFGLGFSASGASTPLPWNWQIGPSASWIPFDGFQNLSSIDEAVANLRAARAARAAAGQQAWLDVRTAWIATLDARRRLDLTALLVRDAEQGLTLSQGRFDVGKGTAIELTDAQQALTKARSDDVQARADLEIAAARLARAVGSSVPAAAEKNP